MASVCNKTDEQGIIDIKNTVVWVMNLVDSVDDNDNIIEEEDDIDNILDDPQRQLIPNKLIINHLQHQLQQSTTLYNWSISVTVIDINKFLLPNYDVTLLPNYDVTQGANQIANKTLMNSTQTKAHIKDMCTLALPDLDTIDARFHKSKATVGAWKQIDHNVIQRNYWQHQFAMMTIV